MLSMCYNTDTKREEHNTYTKGDNDYVQLGRRDQ